MGDAPGAVAKAFLDALPSLDFKKMVDDARRQLSIVVMGDQEPAERIVDVLRGDGLVPEDSKLQIWRHTPGEPAPKDSGKPELVIVVPATPEYVADARLAFSGVPLIPIVLGDGARNADLVDPLVMSHVERSAIRRLLVPRLATSLWDRRLALGRGLPGMRRHLAWRLTQAASKDPRVLLGSVAGAGAGRSGAPTAATAQLLMHQAALIVAIAAISGSSLDERTAIFKRAAPTMVPTLLLDGAEAGLSRFATGGGDRKYGKIYGQVAAYVARPALSASSTLLAGALARRAFREGDDAPNPSVLRNTRNAGRRLVVGAAQGTAVVVAAVGTKLRLPGRARPYPAPPTADQAQPEPGDVAASGEDMDGAAQP